MADFDRYGDLDEKIAKKIKKKAKKKIKKGVKRLNGWTLFFCVIALAAGVAAGIGAHNFVCRNDEFELKGKKEHYLELGLGVFEYTDAGVSIVEFGKDISGDVKIETNMKELGGGRYEADANVPGKYYIKYTVDSPKYGEVCRIRTFTVGGED
jgi:hypothetical protein